MATTRIGLLISERYHQLFEFELAQLQRRLQQHGTQLSFILLPVQQESTIPFAITDKLQNVLPADDLASITCAYASEDLQFSWSTMLAFFAALRDAPSIQWLQISWIG